jgi:hypothetical protein
MALALAALLGTVLEAKRPGRGGGKGEAPVDGVIIALDSTAMEWYQFKADDGSALDPVYCGGDLTHRPNLNNGERYFVFTQHVEEQVKIVVSPYESAFEQNCAWAWQTDNLDHIPIRPRWSLDGTRVAYTGITYSDDGTQSYGIWVVEFDEQSGLGTPHKTDIDVDPYSPLSFLPDLPDADGCNCWVTYSGYTNNEYGIWVANLDTGSAFNVTTNLSISGSHPAFSPVVEVDGNDPLYRVAFIQNTNTGGGSIIYHIFVSTLAFDGDNNPDTLINITQVTSKKNANLAQISNPSWSPDGKHLLFSGTDLSADIDFDIYRVRADGKGKAVLLTDGSPEPDLFWTGGHWRKSP